MRIDRIKEILDPEVDKFNQPDFIASDPITIPHQFSKKQDIEIAGFIAAVFAWGNRTTIIRKSNEFLDLMDRSPHEFLLTHRDSDLKPFLKFVHRTFQPTDALYFLDMLSRHYRQSSSLEDLFLSAGPMENMLSVFHHRFFDAEHAPQRTRKHIPTPQRKSTCKRLNMFLRWMVRKDDKGVDFGLWNNLSPADLICPIDVHVSNVSRKLGLLRRPQNDWQAAVELTDYLKKLDAEDPVKYDFALFGIGVSGRLAEIIR